MIIFYLCLLIIGSIKKLKINFIKNIGQIITFKKSINIDLTLKGSVKNLKIIEMIKNTTAQIK